MKQFVRNLARSVLLLILFLTPVLHAKATTVVMLTDSQLIVNSRLIVTGKVTSVMSAWDDTRSTIWTYVEVRVDRMLKGQLSEDTIVLKQLGGETGNSGMRVFGQPDFTAGERVLLYLNTSADGSLHSAHAFMGKFSVVVSDSDAGFVQRSSDVHDIEFLSHPSEADITNRAPFHSYVQKIKQTLRQEAAQIAEIDASHLSDPLVAVPPEYSRIKQERSGFRTEYALMAGGVRWMEADSGQPISYYLNPNASPVSGGGSAEIGRAMSAWSAQSGAAIHLQVAGQTGSCGIVIDNVNTISFGDCLGQLDPPIGGCSGVVALTGINYTNESKVVGGISFNRLVEADTVFNKGMNCFLANSANLAEVACHELGHSIGLAHSSDPSAIMWPSARGNGHDATLGNDDKAGVLAIYPSSSGGGGPGGGTGGGVAVTIATAGLNSGIVGQKYNANLAASGGTSPYRWALVGGALPSGLDMSGSGTITGTPSTVGTSQFLVQVSDASSPTRTDSRWLSISIQTSGGPTLPVIAGVRPKSEKKLFVDGFNLATTSLVVINGVTFEPRRIDQDGSTYSVLVKGKLNLGPPGSNVIFVITIFNNSLPFAF